MTAATCVLACGELLGGGEDERPIPERDGAAPDDAFAPPIVEAGSEASGPRLKLFFVTERTYDGDLDTIDGGDTRCAIEAAENGWGGTFHVHIKATNADDPSARTSDERRMNQSGALVFDGGPGLPLIPLSSTIDGGLLDAGARVWTGSQAFGPSDLCSPGTGGVAWTSNAPGRSAPIGNPHATDGAWRTAGSVTCDTRRHLYCYEQ